MNILQHGHLSERKFGGSYKDYLEIHKFMDSSKLYFHHVKHRAVLHNTFGVELAVELFGDEVPSKSGKSVSVRDVAIAHVKEDLSGMVPSLADWFKQARYLEPYCPEVPQSIDESVKSFVMRPFLRSGLEFTMFITLSDFGVFLCEQLLGVDAALQLRKSLTVKNTLRWPLTQFEFRHPWQYTPDPQELNWLAENGFM